jgi:F-type H+-transporting ATPase subunit alpha
MKSKLLEPKNISQAIKEEIERFEFRVEEKNIGQIAEVGDGIAFITGLSSCTLGEIIKFPRQTYGLALNLGRQQVGAIILGDYSHLKAGEETETTGRQLSVPVSEALLGRVVDPLGRALDGKPAIRPKKFQPIEKIAPSVVQREPVNTPLQTGIKAIDSMIPIGRGQRELIIGDRGTGKSAIPLTTIINQKNKDVVCIYVAIGQKNSFLAQTISVFEEFGAMEHTIIVAASSSSSPALQYLAPYAGCAIGEYFLEKGKDALVVYDDLTKHAWAYREVSLLLRRPSGREAYPGDIFYLHSRLLERACKLSKKFGGGSLTALPIIETQAGDISAYIPTNVISITDGQIYLEPDLFYSGQRPAINVGLSVSRVGGAAQIKAMKQVAGKLRLDLAQYRELAAFAQFSADLDEKTKSQLNRGEKISEILKQGWETPMGVEKQIQILWAATSGQLDDIDIGKIKEFESKFIEYLSSKHPEIEKEIKTKKEISQKLFEKLEKLTADFKLKEGLIKQPEVTEESPQEKGNHL